jgi:hypothetical protein
MDIERDEMFRLTSYKLANWNMAAKLAAEGAKKGGALASAGGEAGIASDNKKKDKPNPN